MIAYFDTSAVVPLLIAERTTASATELWESADRVVTVRVMYAEARAALAQATRLERITSRQRRSAVTALDALLDDLDVVEVDRTLCHRAGDLADEHGLRGYDALHLAAADRVRDDDLVVVAGDAALLAAAQAKGILVAALT